MTNIGTRQKLLVSVALTILSIVLALLAIGKVQAAPVRYLIDDPDFQLGHPPTNPWTWLWHQGVVGNGLTPPSPTTLKWCNSLGGYSTEASNVISRWETTLGGWSQFSANCSSPDLNIAWEPTSGSKCPTHPPPSNFNPIACYHVDTWVSGGTRSGLYVSKVTVYLDPVVTGGWDSTKVTKVLAHEVGHGMGLGEWYLSGGGCNPNPPSTVMNWPSCQPVTPTASDISDVNSLYGQTAPSGLVGWNCSSHYGGARTLCVNWWDAEAANAFTYFDTWRCPSTPSCGSPSYHGAVWSVPGSGYYGAANSAPSYTLPSSGYYWASVYYYNAATGLGAGANTSPVFIP